MMTIAQVSATFVAIVSGFYTAKILSLSSDKQRIRNKIVEITAESSARLQNYEHYENKVNAHYAEIAKKNVVDFVNDLVLEDELKEYSNEELIAKYKEIEGEEPDEETRAVLSTEQSNINERIRNELKERGQPKPMPLGMPTFEITREMRRSVASSVKISPSMIELSGQLNDLVREWASKRDDEGAQVRVLTAHKKHLEQELKTVSFPRHITFGYISQVFFAVTGVVVPLTYGSWSGDLDDKANVVALVLFGAGLVTMFSYILTEVMGALHTEKAATEQHVKT